MLGLLGYSGCTKSKGKLICRSHAVVDALRGCRIAPSRFSWPQIGRSHGVGVGATHQRIRELSRGPASQSSVND